MYILYPPRSAVWGTIYIEVDKRDNNHVIFGNINWMALHVMGPSDIRLGRVKLSFVWLMLSVVNDVIL